MAKTEELAGGGHKVSASNEERKSKKKKLHRLSIERAKNGGHTVEHSYRNNGLGAHEYEPPVTHVFSKKDGSELIQHLKRHLGIMDGQHGAAGVVNEGEDEG